jgi:succinate-semialdehyde dehydrogenase/glutarate-semialdehyde dehydrogenase
MSKIAGAAIDPVPKQLLVGGHWVDADGRARFEVENPATGETLCEVADATAADAEAALAAAAGAQAGFAAMAHRQRGEFLRRTFEAMVERAEELAYVMTLEMGKPLSESRAEVLYAAEFFRWFSEEAVRVDGHYGRAPEGTNRLLVMRQPVGRASWSRLGTSLWPWGRAR